MPSSRVPVHCRQWGAVGLLQCSTGGRKEPETKGALNFDKPCANSRDTSGTLQHAPIPYLPLRREGGLPSLNLHRKLGKRRRALCKSHWWARLAGTIVQCMHPCLLRTLCGLCQDACAGGALWCESYYCTEILRKVLCDHSVYPGCRTASTPNGMRMPTVTLPLFVQVYSLLLRDD